MDKLIVIAVLLIAFIVGTSVGVNRRIWEAANTAAVNTAAQKAAAMKIVVRLADAAEQAKKEGRPCAHLFLEAAKMAAEAGLQEEAEKYAAIAFEEEKREEQQRRQAERDYSGWTASQIGT